MDYYKHNLKRAMYDWREDQRPGKHKKDRVNGRAERRNAKQRVKREALDSIKNG
jgi:hypothetical protein